MKMCVEEEVLQAFADGELSPDLTNEVASHVAACSRCAGALERAQHEMAMVAAAFAPELNASVPTERLRARLDSAIAAQNAATERIVARATSGAQWSMKGLLAALVAPLSVSPRRAVAFASLVAVACLATILVVVQLREREPAQIAATNTPAAPSNEANLPVPPPSSAPSSAASSDIVASSSLPASNSQTALPATPSRENQVRVPVLTPSSIRQSRDAARTSVVSPRELNTIAARNGAESNNAVALLPGERSYLRAISSLTQTIESGNNVMMTPTLRAEYERSVAVVDQSIYAARSAAQQHQNDPEATRFLLTAYQNKIDLLQTFADQTRLMASAR